MFRILIVSIAVLTITAIVFTGFQIQKVKPLIVQKLQADVRTANANERIAGALEQLALEKNTVKTPKIRARTQQEELRDAVRDKTVYLPLPGYNH